MATHKPLPPNFVSERARIQEHNMFMASAQALYGTKMICPDCYKPGSMCPHLKQERPK